MTATISGKHRYINDNSRELIEKNIVSEPVFVPAGDEVIVPRGMMVLMRTCREDDPSAAVWTQEGMGYVRQGPFLIEAVAETTISGPAYVSSPVRSILDTKVNATKSSFLKIAVPMLFAIYALNSGLVWFLQGDQFNPTYWAIIAFGFVFCSGLIVFFHKRGVVIKTAELRTFPKGVKKIQSSDGRWVYVDVT